MVKHKAWQVAGFLVLKALIQVVCDMLRDRLKDRVLELCNGLYRNLWFLVKKKNRKYRLINVVMEMNKHIVWDANLHPLVDNFLEEFVGCRIALLVNFFSGYD